MRVIKYYIVLILFMFCACVAHSQEKHTEIIINFRVNSNVIDSAYSDNIVGMHDILEFIQNIRNSSSISLAKMSLYGSASLDGNSQKNRKLALERLNALERFIRNKIDIPDSLITRKNNCVQWNYLKYLVEQSDLTFKDDVIAILEENESADYYSSDIGADSKIVKLQALDKGRVWRKINELFSKRMRNAYVVFVTCNNKLPVVQASVITSNIIKQESAIETIDIAYDSITVMPVCLQEEWNSKLYLKTNVIAWGMAIANVAAEIDLARHWSFTLPFYYSAWDYLKSTFKLRTFALQPELRYWFSDKNDGLFAGAHFGLAYYNLAFAGDYRYQCGDMPAIGGGVSMGYRMPIGKNNHWRVEFSLGAGAYSLDYDKFNNTPRTKDGLMVGSVEKTWFGIDQAAVSFSYSFNLNRKGGRQ